MGVKKEERETIIVFSEAESEASVYTFNTELKKRFARFSKQFPELCRLERTFPDGAVEYLIDKHRLTIRCNAPFTEERRKAALPTWYTKSPPASSAYSAAYACP